MISTFSGFLRDCAVALDMVRTFSQKDRNLFPGCYRVILPGFGGCYIMKEWDWDLRCFSMNPRTFHSSIVLLLAMCHIYTIYIYIHTYIYVYACQIQDHKIFMYQYYLYTIHVYQCFNIYIYCIWSNDLIPKYIAISIRQRMPSMYFQTCFASVLVTVVAYFGELKDNPNVLCNGVPLHPLL